MATINGTSGDDILIASSNSAFNGESNILLTGAGSDRIDLRPVSANPNSGNNIMTMDCLLTWHQMTSDLTP